MDYRGRNSTTTEEASRFQRFFRRWLAPGRASGEISLHWLQYPWMDNCLAVHSWVLVDYPDADLSVIVVNSTSVSPKDCCLPCQKSHLSLPRKSDVFKINDDNYINEIC